MARALEFICGSRWCGLGGEGGGGGVNLDTSGGGIHKRGGGEAWPVKSFALKSANNA